MDEKMTFCPMSDVLQFKVLGSMVREERNKVALLQFERDLLTSRFAQQVFSAARLLRLLADILTSRSAKITSRSSD